MVRKRVKLPAILVVIALKMAVLFGGGDAAAPEVKLVVNPKQTDVYARSGEIVITVKAPGKNLTFTWKLDGPGKLKGEGAARFYILPDKIEKESVQATVSVIVKDRTGQETTQTVTFTILAAPTKTSAPSPELKPTVKKGMGKGTITALGLGAAAALGGGIALATSGDGSPMSTPTPIPTPTPVPCDGVKVGGYCWYLGGGGQSCYDVCSSHGGYHEATRTYAGSDGSISNCEAVLNALGVPAGIIGTHVGNCGCKYQPNASPNRWWLIWPTTATCEPMSTERRACACNE